MVTDRTAGRQAVRLLLIDPAPPAEGHDGPQRYPAPALLAPTTTVDRVFCAGAPPQIWDAADCARVAPLILDKTRWAAARRYDAVVVNCMLDPGVASAKRAVRMPVVGAGEASLALARLLGNRVARIYPAGIPVRALLQDVEATYVGLAAAGRAEVERGADVLVLGCAVLNPFAARLRNEFDVPVLPNEDIALKVAELLAMCGLHAAEPQPLRARLLWLGRTLAQRVSRLTSLMKH